ncbi:DUF1796 family putative cysteine peptidase [Oceanicella sp. SM1341]|uniref:DUF1796 family putative cysteine peptidase n=1 Tax=Oceanicella sp. SM1341 TaxID=1548889 RepID=UPI000E4A3B3E|nr:DUF1796 family putative cysteine peptidase [Oceanicella sp. SM1341]
MDLDQLANDRFDETDIRHRLTGMLSDIFLNTAQKGFSVSARDIAALREARDASAALVTDYFDRMIGLAEERRRNLPLFCGIRFVSLGEDCFARTVLARWGVRGFSGIGDRSGPFDLAVHPLASVTELIGNGFDGYMDPANLAFRPERNICVNTRYDVKFNHEADERFAAEDFGLLRSTYARRMAVLDEIMRDPAPVVLVAHTKTPARALDAPLLALWEAIGRRWGTQGRILLGLDTWPGANNDRAAGVRQIAPQVTAFAIPRPGADYTWHRPRACFSPEGEAFERRVVDFVKHAAQAAFAPAGVREAEPVG